MGEPIPFGSAQKSGFDVETGAGPAAFNVYTDARGAVRRRPGITTYAEAPTGVVDARGIDGLFVTDEGRILAVSGAGNVTQRALYEIDGGASRKLVGVIPGNGRAQFAQTDMLVVIATGGQPIKYVRTDRTAAYLGGAPPPGTHIATGAQRLLMNDPTQPSAVRFSATAQGLITYAGHEQWTLTNPVTSGQLGADRRPDPIVALADSTNDVFAWGAYSLQLFSPDAQFGFAPSGTIELGCVAPYSIIKADNQFFWLDQFRRFVMSDGRSQDDISADIAQTVAQLERVDDCFGYRVSIGNLDALVWTFPSAGLTFAYQKSIGWAQWAGYDTNLSRFKVNAHTYRSGAGVSVVGTSDGRIGQLDLESTTDLGETVLARSTTGFLDRGTDARKNSKVVRLALRRGKFTGATGPHAYLSFRDRLGPWQARIPVDLGGSKDTEAVVELRSLGVYRRRQWMFEFSGTEELVLARASEEFEVLGQ